MGDNLDTNIENEATFVVNDVAIADSDEDIDNEPSDEINLNEKKLKKKRKFAELKAVIADIKNKTSTKEEVQILQPETQFDYILKFMSCSSGLFFSTIRPVNFFNPNPPSAIQRPCKFVTAIASGIHGFRSVIKKVPEELGCPFVVIVSGSANRCVEIIKSVSKGLKCKVAKLFSRHVKIQEQVDILKNHHPVAVGTPNRLHKLIEIGALSISQTKLILIDMEKDAKNFTILSMKDVKQDFLDLMNSDVTPELDHIKLALICGSSGTLPLPDI